MFNDGKRLWFMIMMALSTLLGCGSSPDRTDEDSAQLGTLSAALVATGSDGASYRFPEGALLSVWGGSFTASLPLNSSANEVSAKLPQGVFRWAVRGATQLERTSSGTTKLVDATLMNLEPVDFEIVENQVTSLELRFQIADVSAVTFSVGSLEVGLDVEVEERPFGRQVLIDATAHIQESTYATWVSSDARRLLAVDGDPAIPFQLVFEPNSAWKVEGENTACVHGRLTSAQSSPANRLYARFAEFIGSEGRYCITDYGAQDLASLNIHTTTPPADQLALFGDDTIYYLLVEGTIDDVFDGSTLRQKELVQPHIFSGGRFSHRVVGVRRNLAAVSLFASADGEFELKP